MVNNDVQTPYPAPFHRFASEHNQAVEYKYDLPLELLERYFEEKKELQDSNF